MTDYSLELRTRLALAVLRGENSRDVALRHEIPEELVIEWALRISQRSEQILGDGISGETVPASAQNNLRLCFIRNEKTAGTALGSHLEDFFAVKDICPVLHQEELVDAALRQDMMQFRLFHGHFHLGWFLDHTKLNFANTKFMTFIRHPLQRQISLYKHWMREPLRVNYVNRLLDLYSIQCFRLSPLPMRRGYATTREHLDAAKAALEDFFFVGLHERLPQSLASLSRLLDWPVPSHVRELNIDPYDPPDLPQALKDEIVARNWADVELHEYATALFERKFVDVPPDPAWVLEIAERVTFRIDQAMYGDGWHFREGVGVAEVPQPWRWSGPGTESWIAFNVVAGRDYRLAVRIVNFLAPDVLASVRIFVNDTPVALTETRDTSWGLILQGVVPRAAFATSSPNARIRFTVNRTIRFCDADPKSKDRRLCGIAISEVNLEPLEA